MIKFKIKIKRFEISFINRKVLVPVQQGIIVLVGGWGENVKFFSFLWFMNEQLNG